jgi:hypothetical protein
MLKRFAAAASVASVAIAGASLTVILIPAFTVERFGRVMSVWCVVPAVWGLWAMITPKSWIPQRLPTWGAILGVIAGALAIFVLDLPSEIAGTTLQMWMRLVGMLLPIAGYFLLWMAVRAAYRVLAQP